MYERTEYVISTCVFVLGKRGALLGDRLIDGDLCSMGA